MRSYLEKSAFLFFLLALLTVTCNCHGKGVFIIIKNNSGTDILNLKISYVGGSLEKNLIRNKQIFSGYVNPISESSLLVIFKNREGKIIRKDIDVYIEKNYKGKIEIIILPNYRLIVKDNIHI